MKSSYTQYNSYTPSINSFVNCIIIIVIILSFYDTSYTQSVIPQDTIQLDSVEAAKLGLFNDENKKTFKVMFSGKPGKAGLFSLIIPGGGQAYNRRYWKIPIVWGALGYFGYQALDSNKEYKDIDDIYRGILRGEDITYNGINDKTYIRNERDKIRLKNEKNWVTFSLIYLVQAIEAYIDRHLIDFDLSEDLSFTPSVDQGIMNLGLSINLNSKNKQKK